MSNFDLHIRSATFDDVDEVLKLFDRSRKSLREMGIDQWQDGYPFKEDIDSDIENARAYVLLREGELVGYFAYATGKEDVYENIAEGAFREEKKYRYSAVHRVAVTPEHRGHGYGVRIFEYAVKLAHIDQARSLRCDTHEDNKPMRALLTKCGFQYCGVVYYVRGEKKDKRIAFDLLL